MIKFMLGVFFAIFFFAYLVSKAASSKRGANSRLLLPGQVDENFSRALKSGDHKTLVHYYQLALSKKLSTKDEQLVRINLAYTLTAMGNYHQALDEIDRVSLAELSPTQVALWLNNRAYILAQMERSDDALDNIKDAEELLSGSEMAAKDMLLISCLNGTRGLALFKKGDLDGAEKALELALQLEPQETSVQSVSGVYNSQDASRTAERWLLLSEISKQKGNHDEMKKRLQRAAYHPLTPPGAKAIAALKKINLLH